MAENVKKSRVVHVHGLETFSKSLIKTQTKVCKLVEMPELQFSEDFRSLELLWKNL